MMATKPLTSEAIALTEKKMDMTLDDIIKMSKTNTFKPKKQRTSNKNQRFSSGNQDKSLKIRQYMDSRSMVRQGVLAQRRSNFQGNSFTQAADAARKAVFAPFRTRAFNRNRDTNWNKTRPGGSLRRQGIHSNGGNALKQQQQQPPQSGDSMRKQKPKTLDSLFANMKEQRMKAVTRMNNGGGGGRHGVGNQRRQPWLRGRFGYYWN